MIFVPFGALLLLFAAYGLYWLSAASRAADAVGSWADTQAATGIRSAWDDLSVSGFPFRLAVTATHPLMAHPGSPLDWEWQADALTGQVLPYRLDHVIFDLRGEHIFRYTERSAGLAVRHEVRATAENALASYVAEPGTAGRFAIDIESLEAYRDIVGGDYADLLSASRLQLHMRPASAEVGGGPGEVDAALRAAAVSLILKQRQLPFGPEAEAVEIQARIRHAPRRIEGTARQMLRRWAQSGGSLALSRLRVIWGPLDLEASGDLSFDAQGRPAGTFDALIANHRDLLAALVSAGIVERRDADAAFAGLEIVSTLQNNGDGRLQVPVIMRDGMLYLGPLAVARLESVY